MDYERDLQREGPGETAAGIFGTSRLVTSDGDGAHGSLVLVPQPTQDPNDPLNWSKPKKLATIAGICCFSFSCGMVVTGPVAAWVYTEEETGISQTGLNYALAVCLLGLGFGNIGYSLISTQLGRRTVYLLGSAGGICVSAWTAIYSTSASNYARQLFLGLLLAPYEGMAMTIAGDLFFLHERGSYMAFILFVYPQEDNI